MRTTNFKTDLEIGERAERVLGNYLIDNFNYEIEYNKDKDMKYDLHIKTPLMDLTLELKTDAYEYYHKRQTNNIFIETSCSGKKSGLIGSSADMFAYYFPHLGELYIQYIGKLKKNMIENPDKFHYVSGCGDGGRVNGYLINRYEWGQDFFNMKRMPINKKIIDYIYH